MEADARYRPGMSEATAVYWKFLTRFQDLQQQCSEDAIISFLTDRCKVERGLIEKWIQEPENGGSFVLKKTLLTTLQNARPEEVKTFQKLRPPLKK